MPLVEPSPGAAALAPDPSLRAAVLNSAAPLAEREAAARALAESGEPVAVGLLLAGLRREEDPAAKDVLVRSLQAVQDVRAAPALVLALPLTQDDPRLDGAVVEALARLADATAAAQTLALYETGGLSEPQREHVLEAIARFGNPAAIPPLAGVLEREADPALRAGAARALARIGEDPAVAALAAAIAREPQPDTTDPLVESLAAVRNKESYARLIGLFMTTTNPTLRHAAACALARAGEEGRAFGVREAGVRSGP